MRRFAIVTAAVLIAVPAAGCGSDDEESTSALEETASAEEVTLTADDISETEKSFELSATPSAETNSTRS